MRNIPTSNIVTAVLWMDTCHVVILEICRLGMLSQSSWVKDFKPQWRCQGLAANEYAEVLQSLVALFKRFDISCHFVRMNLSHSLRLWNKQPTGPVYSVHFPRW